jgi:hypothetical protein
VTIPMKRELKPFTGFLGCKKAAAVEVKSMQRKFDRMAGAALTLLAVMCLTMNTLVSLAAAECSLSNDDYSLTMNLSGSDCPLIEIIPSSEGWSSVKALQKDTTRIKLMKANPEENVSSINLYEDVVSILSSFGGNKISIVPISVSGYDGVKASGTFPDGSTAVQIEIVLLDRNGLVSVSSQNETDVAAVEGMTIQAV